MSKFTQARTTLFDIYENEITASELVPILNAKEIKVVRYAGQLLSKLSSADEIEELKRIDFEEQEAKKRRQPYRFTNDLFLESEIKSNYLKSIKTTSEFDKNELYTKQITDFLQGKKSVDFIICNMGKANGSGVFAGQQIPGDTFLTIYNGQLSSEVSYPKKKPDLAYAFYAKTDAFLYAQISIYSDGSTMITSNESSPFVILADGQGSYGTFFQHLPDQKSLTKMGLPLEWSRYIATDNVKVISVSYNGFPVIVLESSRKIFSGEQIGFNYSQNPKTRYWSSQNTYALFNRRGEEIVSVIEGAISPEDIKNFPTKILRTELAYHTAKVNPNLVKLWKFTTKSAYLIAGRDTLLPLARQLKKIGIEIKFSQVTGSQDYALVVKNSQYQKFLEVAETADLSPKF
jgi:hypothetical protein